VGEVQSRAHAEGESESHLESSSRVFSNPNRCQAVTYFFYKINKLQVVRFRLVAVQRVLWDPTAPTVPDRRIVPNLTGNVAVMPQAVLATDKNRLDIERIARQAAVEREQGTVGMAGVGAFSDVRFRASNLRAEPMAREVRTDALKAVDNELADEGIIDKATGEPSSELIRALSFESRVWLPTPGILVKGCLDECNTCEPALQRQIGLELEHQKLQNQLLSRQIELLDKAQEYRCCPGGESDGDDDD
jgi:hypothetical protein